MLFLLEGLRRDGGGFNERVLNTRSCDFFRVAFS